MTAPGEPKRGASDFAVGGVCVLMGLSVVILLVALCVGLITTPDGFTNTTGKGPSTREQARLLGGLLSFALVIGTALLSRRILHRK